MKQVNKKNNEKGVAFVILLIVISFLSMISISYLFMSRIQQIKSSKQEQSITALSTAEAGLDRAIWYLINNAEGNLPNWSAPTPGNPVTISESISKKSGFTAKIEYVSEGIYKIISTGSETISFLGKTTQRRIEALGKIKQMTGANGFDGSIICKSDITGVGNATTDSYDSSKGAFGPGNNGQEGNIFSNAGISLVGNSLVDGDAHYGPDDNISLTGNANVTGDKGALGQEISLPAVTVPSGATDKGQINNNLTLTTGTYTCSGITLSGKEQLTIQGDVKLYCTGNIQISGNGSIDSSNGNATNFHIYCTDAVTSVDVVGNGKFFGTIYAPGAEIKVSGNGNVFGQLVGNTVKFNGGGAVIYDEQLKKTLWWPGKPKWTRDIIYWREVGL